MNNTQEHKEEREGTHKPMGRPPKEQYKTRRWEVALPADLDKALEDLAPGEGFDLLKEIVRADPRIQAWIKAHESELKPFKRPSRAKHPKG